MADARLPNLALALRPANEQLDEPPEMKPCAQAQSSPPRKPLVWEPPQARQWPERRERSPRRSPGRSFQRKHRTDFETFCAGGRQFNVYYGPDRHVRVLEARVVQTQPVVLETDNFALRLVCELGGKLDRYASLHTHPQPGFNDRFCVRSNHPEDLEGAVRVAKQWLHREFEPKHEFNPPGPPPGPPPAAVAASDFLRQMQPPETFRVVATGASMGTINKLLPLVSSSEGVFTLSFAA
jgi:hypothetical protein